MAPLPETEDYRALFLQHIPMIDLRAPCEFARGAFPSALSLPLMTDDERAQVGTCYKQYGQAVAIDLGHQLVQGAAREQRIAAWVSFANAHPAGALYCWRGGLRSQTVQQWLADEGVHYPRVRGGYKAMRTFLLESLASCVQQANFVLISGKTGTGKTRVIERLQRTVDLEGLANHRGSSFGQLPVAQPSQIDFENSLSIALLRLTEQADTPIFLEDEGRLIGRLSLPDILRAKMKTTAMAVVEEPLAARVQVVVEDYILDLGQRYAMLFGPEGAELHAQKMQDDLVRIRKRLGGDRYQQVSAQMHSAFELQWRSGDLSGHRTWIAFLLEKYYDPMYEYQLEQRAGRQIFVGDRAAVLEWAAEQAS